MDIADYGAPDYWGLCPNRGCRVARGSRFTNIFDLAGEGLIPFPAILRVKIATEMEAGIVGLPNVGKSTLFNALTSSQGAQAANYPFCTIEPNEGIVSVPDERLTRISALIKPKKILPAYLKLVDIAGIVKGASEGQGLGNKFLSHIRQVDAILQVVRCFDDPDVIHVSGQVDPVADVEIIETELMMADIQTLE